MNNLQKALLAIIANLLPYRTDLARETASGEVDRVRQNAQDQMRINTVGEATASTGMFISLPDGPNAGLHEIASVPDPDRILCTTENAQDQDGGRYRVITVETARIQSAMAATLSDIEETTQMSFQGPAEYTEAVSGSGRRTVMLSRSAIRDLVRIEGDYAPRVEDIDLNEARTAGMLRTTREHLTWAPGDRNFQITYTAGFSEEDWPRQFLGGLVLLSSALLLSFQADIEDEGVEQHGADGYSETLGEGGRYSRTIRQWRAQGLQLIGRYTSGVIA